MLQHTTRYGISATVPLPFDQAPARTREALGGEGFGRLQPPLAHRALQAEAEEVRDRLQRVVASVGGP